MPILTDHVETYLHDLRPPRSRVMADKDEYRDYLELAEPKLSAQALLVVDNLLMSGEVAHPEGGGGMWSRETVEAARAFNTALIASERWRGAVLPVGDGVGLASRVARA